MIFLHHPRLFSIQLRSRISLIECLGVIKPCILEFWDLHLKATVFKKIDLSEQKQQFCVGLNEDMKAYVNAQKPKTILEVIHHAMVASKIFFSSKGVPKQGDHQEKTNEKERVSRDAKFLGNKESRPNGGKTKNHLTEKMPWP